MSERKSSPVSLRTVLLVLVLIGFTVLVVTRFTSFHELITRMAQGNLLWIMAGFVLHVLYFYVYAVLYHNSFLTVEIDIKAIKLLPVLLTSLFINAAAPTGGIGGAAIFIDYTSRSGYSGSRTTVAVLLTLIADLFTLIPFILAGLIFLWSQHQLKFYEWLAFIFYAVFIGGLVFVLMVARLKPDWVRKLFKKISHVIHKVGEIIHRPDLISEKWAEGNSKEFIDGSNIISHRKKRLGITLLWGTFLHFINIAGLFMFFKAYQQPINLGTLNAAFSLGVVFFVISIIPQGVGAVEGIMSLVLIDMGITATNAAVISVVFRGVNFWLPILVGLVGYRVLFSHPEKNKPERKSAEPRSEEPAEPGGSEE